MINRALLPTMCLVLSILPGCAGLEYGCSDADERLGPILNSMPVIDARPDGTVVLDSSSGCDNDEAVAFSSRTYQSPMRQDRVLAFYRSAATEDGWQYLEYTEQPDRAGPLYSKSVDGTTALLRIWFTSFDGIVAPPATGPDELSIFTVDITGSHDD